CNLSILANDYSAIWLLYYLRYCRHYFHRRLHSFPTRRSSDLYEAGTRGEEDAGQQEDDHGGHEQNEQHRGPGAAHLDPFQQHDRSEEHTSELQSRENLVCRLLLEKKNGSSHNGATAQDNPNVV